MKILVTGATGLFGPYLVRHLKKAGHRLRILVHSKSLSFEGVELVQGDVSKMETIRQACTGMDAVCHLATVKGRSDDFLSVNLGGLYNLLEFAVKENSKSQIILLSGDNVLPIYDYETPGPMDEEHPRLFVDDRYGLSKILEETMALQYARKYSLPVTVLRSSWIMDNQRSTLLCHPKRGGFLNDLTPELRSRFDRGEEFRVVPLDREGRPLRRHVMDPRDLCTAFTCALGNKAAFGELFNVAGPAPFDYRELADYMNRKHALPVFDLLIPAAHSFKINTAKASAIGFRPAHSIYDTVEWALAGNPESTHG